ncbi:hypothetical protein V1478_010172 [Vespula squamosa]|uniref:Uncharacterized protein n=1 Tax=Vespula squamosa TaxID=30214 RepID=A0ABD2AJ00_VESSQ
MKYTIFKKSSFPIVYFSPSSTKKSTFLVNLLSSLQRHVRVYVDQIESLDFAKNLRSCTPGSVPTDNFLRMDTNVKTGYARTGNF